MKGMNGRGMETDRERKDFLADVEEDKRHVASFEAKRVEAAHEDSRQVSRAIHISSHRSFAPPRQHSCTF